MCSSTTCTNTEQVHLFSPEIKRLQELKRFSIATPVETRLSSGLINAMSKEMSTTGNFVRNNLSVCNYWKNHVKWHPH